MDKAAEVRDFTSLFEPMPAEELERQSRDFPLNEPLKAQERKEALDWLLSPEGGGVKVKLVAPYDNPIYRNALVESMLLHPWFAPSKELANKIPLKGTSAHHVQSSTIALNIAEDQPRRIDLAVKPSEANKSRLAAELKRIQKVRERGIPTVEPFGLIEVNDSQGHASYLLTVLRRSVLPLQKINFEQLRDEHKDLKMKQFSDVMDGMAQFIANMHNRGVVHGDLYLRNIAMDLSQSNQGDFLIFDLERSTILGDDKLGLKYKTGITLHDEIAAGLKDFEDKAIDDVACLAADIAVKNEHLTRNMIFSHFVRRYIENRKNSQGQYSGEVFLSKFDDLFNEKLEKLTRAAHFERQLMQQG